MSSARDVNVIYLRDSDEVNELKRLMMDYLRAQEKALEKAKQKQRRLKMELTGRAGVIG